MAAGTPRHCRGGIPKAGSISLMDRAVFETIGRWVSYFDEAIRCPAPTEIAGKPNDFILQNGRHYYLFCYDLPMVADSNVARNDSREYENKFHSVDG